MTRKYLACIALLASCNASFASRQEAYGRSFMFTRPLFNQLSVEQAGWHNLIAQKQNGSYGSFQLLAAYQQNREWEKTNSYFTPESLSVLQIAGDDTSLVDDRTIRAEWLGLPHDFEGNFYFKPEQKQFGMLFEYNQGFARFTERAFFKHAYFSFRLPLTYAQNNLAVESCDTATTVTTQPQTIKEAFTNPSWCYGKATDDRSEFGLQDILIRFGNFFLHNEKNQLGFYIGLSIPTSKEQDPAYWFDPFVGFNGSTAINFGATMQFQINRSDKNPVCFFANIDDMLLIRTHQRRTFDLCGKPWSRFMNFNHESARPNQTDVPGVNLLTQDAIVRPYSFVDFSTGLRIKTVHTEIELGYNLWGHGDEDIKLRYPSDFPAGWGIAGSTAGSSSSGSTIATKAIDDPTFVALESCNLDVNSGAAASALNHALHAALTIMRRGTSVDVILNTGCQVNYPQKNGALQTWTAWAKVGGSF